MSRCVRRSKAEAPSNAVFRVSVLFWMPVWMLSLIVSWPGVDWSYSVLVVWL